MNYKNATYNLLMDYYEKYGKDRTIEIAYNMLQSNRHKEDKAFVSIVHGEICEVIACITIKDYIKHNPQQTKDWFYIKGLILKDLINPNKFTEIDIVLYTPQMVYAIECKCYSGVKILIDKCTIVRGNAKIDVYAQHKLHTQFLEEHIKHGRIITEKTLATQLVLFNFSVGSTKDTRTPKNRIFMINANHETLPKLFDFNKNLSIAWDINFLRKVNKILIGG
ncbi:hypothetical protein AN639_10600 [Candidatus Epulonipiscium fishelsonii]|uniref:Uncharacterized protein n=1 Tax=Candidatus Epulonipiscium fishelsonii TaxID=77094 RepID=A0ACC8XA41_9FIRM|nr:hypothetical protein AN396_09410 [Epulopiscium sp. SCG-B11WGA-EpuloA1]ONI43339.1 hypothetical protein AN639_10600 [Epulopiscium sp. SCG-B05WGA-EpuloA1]